LSFVRLNWSKISDNLQLSGKILLSSTSAQACF